MLKSSEITYKKLLRLPVLGLIFVSSVVFVTLGSLPYFEFYANKSPRVFLASNYEGPPNVDSTNKLTELINRERRELIWGKLNSAGFDRENVIILEEPSPISPQFGEGILEIAESSPEKIVIKTSSKQPKLLFLEKNYSSSWKAKVDSNDLKIFRANYGFMAVPLVAGDHEVRVTYDPIWLKVAVFITGVGLAAYLFQRKIDG